MARLIAAFPDKDEVTYFTIINPFNDEVVAEIRAGYTNADLCVRFAKEASYKVVERTEVVVDKGYATIAGHYRRLTYKGERKTAINYESSLPEDEHYEMVDEIVKALAQEDIAVLRGECEITITTRC
jgi:hypothetical protein